FSGNFKRIAHASHIELVYPSCKYGHDDKHDTRYHKRCETVFYTRTENIIEGDRPGSKQCFQTKRLNSCHYKEQCDKNVRQPRFEHGDVLWRSRFTFHITDPRFIPAFTRFKIKSIFRHQKPFSRKRNDDRQSAKPADDGREFRA